MRKMDIFYKSRHNAYRKVFFTFKNSKNVNSYAFIKSLGDTRTVQYINCAKLNPKTIYKFLNKHVYTKSSENALTNRLIRSEFNLYFYNKLKQNDMNPELLYYSNGDIKTNSSCYGNHIYITNTNKIIKKDILNKLKAAKDKAQKVHIVIPNDSKISKPLIKSINRSGGEIIRTEVSRKDIVNNILYQRKKFKHKYNNINSSQCNRSQSNKPTTTLISKQLKTHNLSQIKNFISILGEQRINQYILSNGDLSNLYRFFNDQTTDINSLLGHELNLFLVEKLKKLNSTQNIHPEFTKKFGNVDVMAYFDKKTRFNIYNPDEKNKTINLNPGYHFFEAKMSLRNMDKKAIDQFLKQLSVFNNLHFFVPKNACINNALYEEFRKYGVNIIMADVTKSELENRLYTLKKIYKQHGLKQTTHTDIKQTNSKDYSYLFDQISEKRANQKKISGRKLNIFLSTLNSFRTNEYLKHNLNIKDCLNFLNGKLKGTPKEKSINKLLSNIEFSIFLQQLLDSHADYINSEHIRPSNTTPNVKIKGYFSDKTPNFKKKIDNGQEIIHNPKLGEHVFFVNLDTELNNELINHIDSAKKKHSNIHVAINADTQLEQEDIKKIYDTGADILAFNISQYYIEHRIQNLKAKFEHLTTIYK